MDALPLANLLALTQGAMADVALVNQFCLVEVDRMTGAITRVRDKVGGLELLTEPGYAGSYVIVLQEADGSRRVVEGKAQRLTSLDETEGALALRWDAPLTDDVGAPQNLTVTMVIRSAGEGVEFVLAVENRTDARLAEVGYPVLGGLTGIGRREDTEQLGGGWCLRAPIPADTRPPAGAWSAGYPQMGMSWTDLYNRRLDRGLYFGDHDPHARIKSVRIDKHPPPGAGTGPVLPAGVMQWLHYPYTKPGETFEGPSVVLQFHQGDWHDAGRIYRDWFTSRFPLPDPHTTWHRRMLAYQDLMLMLPEGNINLTYREIPRWAKGGLKYGVNAVLISGWQVGGHDGDYPLYWPDPRLGTWEELEDAIRACHAMGVRVFSFANFQPVTLDTEWYARELHRYRACDEAGGYPQMGWGMGTVAARMGWTHRVMTFASPGFPEYRAIIARLMRKLAEIGADGLHFDKVWPYGLDFHPDLPVSPDRASTESLVEGLGEVLAACRAISPEFCLSTESHFDRTMPLALVSWTWPSNWAPDIADPMRFVFPEWTSTLAANQPCDYNVVNNAVRNGYQLLIGPANYTATMDDPAYRPLSRYIREVLRIWGELEDTIYLGACLRDEEVRFHGPGDTRCSGYRNRTTDRRAAVMINLAARPREVRFEGFADDAGGGLLYQPFQDPQAVRLPLTLTIPAERLAVLLEDPSVPAAAPTVVGASASPPKPSAIGNGDFETGDFSGWQADPNWVLDDGSLGWYAGWEGRHYAFSGHGGEQATGKLRSAPFTLDEEGVEFLIAGWRAPGGGSDPVWNYVALNLADGTELDRAYAPNTLTFTPALLQGRGHRGATAYLEAVDNADQTGFSMLCVDGFRTAPLPPARSLRYPRSARYETVRLEDSLCRVEVDRGNGALRRIRDKRGDLDLITEPRLAEAFRLCLPLPGTQANYLLSSQQAPPTIREAPGRLVLTWAGPLRNERGQPFDLSATMRVRLADEAVELTLDAANRTDLKLTEVWYPIIGGVRGLGDRQQTATRLPVAGADGFEHLFTATMTGAELGTRGPEYKWTCPGDLAAPWVELRNERLGRGVRFALEDDTDRQKLLVAAMYPGVGHMRTGDTWPRPGEMPSRIPVGMSLQWVYYLPPATTRPGSDFHAAKAVLQFTADD